MWERKLHVKVSDKVSLSMKELTILNSLDGISAIAVSFTTMITGIKEGVVNFVKFRSNQEEIESNMETGGERM